MAAVEALATIILSVGVVAVALGLAGRIALRLRSTHDDRRRA